jgi:hypothetical protein
MSRIFISVSIFYQVKAIYAISGINTSSYHHHQPINPLSAADVYIRQILEFPKRLQSMSFILIVVFRTRKRLTPKDVAAVKGLISLLLRHRPSLWITHKENGP